MDTLVDTLAEVKPVTLGGIRGDAHALVDTLSFTLAQVEVMILGDTGRCSRTGGHFGRLSSRGLGGDTRRHTGRCARTG